MSMRVQVTTGTFLILAGLGLMAYSVYALKEATYVYLPILLWVSTIEYLVGRHWWEDVREVYADWRMISPHAFGRSDAEGHPD